MKLVLVQGFLHPVSTDDYRALVDLGYTGARIPEASFPAMKKTIFKGKVKPSEIEVYAWSDVMDHLVESWLATVPYAIFRNSLTADRLLSEAGVMCRISTEDTDGHVNTASFEEQLGKLKHYLGRYNHLLSTVYEDRPTCRVYTLRVEYSTTLPCIHFYRDITPPNSKVWNLSPSYRIVAEVESVASNQFLSVRAEELMGDKWHSVMHRSFPMARIDKLHLSEFGAFLLGLGSSS